MIKKLLIFGLFSLVLTHTAQAQLFGKKKNKNKKEATAEKPKKDKNGIKKYGDVITEDAVTDDGLFKVHQMEQDYFYEIPFDLLEKDMLWVSRIAQIPDNLGGGYVNAGSKTNEQVVHWQRYQNKILLRVKSYTNIADSTKAISNSVKVNNFEPILFAFDIKAFNADSTAAVIQVDKLFTTDVAAISGLSSRLRQRYKVKKLDQSRSFINNIKSFPENIEVKQDFTYDASEPPSFSDTGSISLQMNQSMILLPEEPMTPRLNDPRVGFFTVSQIDYGSPKLKADQKRYIRRWRLEPKDPEAYARGELVEPVKPIVYYLDPGTPENLQKYIKQGIEDWQKPFETAGFKNAIIAKDAPTPEEDPEFSPEDIRYSVVRYVASTTRNAVGPSVSDPRSGEIIESDIIWYHNHLRSYRNRYLLETGAANPSARTLDTPDEEIGEMMRMVIAHEVGHALGFPHNMAASYAYPVDSLRSGSFTQKNGIAASIMDYARYNYVAQPGDENIRFIRQMGPYDHYAVNWGYRWLPNIQEPEDEKATLNQWILEKADDPKFKYGRQSSYFDPQSQTECIGDDPIKASTYGIKNLKYVMTQLPSWTSDQTNDYDDLEELYGELLGVFNRYVRHVARNVGGVYENIKTPEQEGTVYTALSAEEQRKLMEWLHKNIFETPEWLLDTSVLQNIDHTAYFENVRRVQSSQLNQLMGLETLGRLINSETTQDDNYSAYEMLSDLRKGLWSEAYRSRNVELYRRNLQNTYLDYMADLLTDDDASNYNVETSDVRTLVRGELTTLKRTLNRAKNANVNTMTKYHYENAIAKIDELFDSK
ncbi:MAG: zinc-dependent metalloprotease [Muricauda sp.]|nr:zinc-dependent metalloprotease [Allomuricauda sp.]MBO6532536.1 zinc-dependent metalloprotease [Allomuricauda sp.]MBO6589913.1 zinc-dependent metalloprotease [Allomuricauda sp.]MBO6619539.1 zinc-dependent metalloprotease [Allomuricauda sp.]MBO6645492.1 zinc-dependent metalloprotease [Allomuricauda sp.]MBO6747699.1 zinc-dependent metalloprotease [Allomuricauda sp.]